MQDRNGNNLCTPTNKLCDSDGGRHLGGTNVPPSFGIIFFTGCRRANPIQAILSTPLFSRLVELIQPPWLNWISLFNTWVIVFIVTSHFFSTNDNGAKAATTDTTTTETTAEHSNTSITQVNENTTMVEPSPPPPPPLPLAAAPTSALKNVCKANRCKRIADLENCWVVTCTNFVHAQCSTDLLNFHQVPLAERPEGEYFCGKRCYNKYASIQKQVAEAEAVTETDSNKKKFWESASIVMHRPWPTNMIV